jgi:hypothetical protein
VVPLPTAVTGGSGSSGSGNDSGSVAHEEGGSFLAGMSCQLFFQSLIYMALIAYRKLPSTVPTTHKVKALLLYMLKGAVDSQKTLKVTQKKAVLLFYNYLDLAASLVISLNILHLFPCLIVTCVSVSLCGARC